MEKTEKLWLAVYSNGFVSPIMHSKEDAQNRLLGAADYNGQVVELDVVARHAVVETIKKGTLVVYTPLNLKLVVTDVTGRTVTAVTAGDFDGEATQYSDDIDLFEKVG